MIIEILATLQFESHLLFYAMQVFLEFIEFFQYFLHFIEFYFPRL
jgi:hypothetical protein